MSETVTLLVYLVIVFAGLGGLLYLLAMRQQKARLAAMAAAGVHVGGPAGGVRGGAAAAAIAQDVEAGGGARRRLAAMRQRREGGEDDDEEEEEIRVGKKIGKKKMEKLEMKEQKRAMREAEAEARTRRGHEEEERKLLRKEQEEERAEQERQKELEEEKKRLEAKKKEEEEFDKWKDMFSVEAGGSVAVEQESENQGLLQEFVDYIQERKIVPLEELGAHFQLRAQDVVNRVTALQEMGRITGLLDDRGKFIYIKEEEMQAVARFINLRGRVNITEIASESNKLIDLKGTSAPPPKGIQAAPIAAAVSEEGGAAVSAAAS